MRIFEHPNIVRYISSPIEDCCIIYMEYCSKGSLSDIIRKKYSISQLFPEMNEHFTEIEIIDYYIGITLGLTKIHNEKIIHRDIKPSNIFITEDGTPKIGDFGCACGIKETDKKKKIAGSEYYMAPEVKCGEEYDIKADYWSFGCLLYQLCTFSNKNIDIGNIPPIYSNRLKNIIAKLLEKDPKKRFLEEIKIDDFNEDNKVVIGFIEGGDYEKAIQKCNELFNKYEQSKYRFEICKNIGRCCYEQSLYLESLDSYMKLLNYIRNDNDYYIANVNIANSYFILVYNILLLLKIGILYYFIEILQIC